MKKLLLTIMLSIVSLLAITSCNSNNNNDETIDTPNINIPEETPKEDPNPIILINLSNDKTIKCELYPKIAPITVDYILTLIDEEYYTDTVFHRVIDNFMIQTGGFQLVDKTIYRKPSKDTIKGEFANNGIENNLLHTPGVLSLARGNGYDTGSAQFFICVNTCTWLDGDYAAFGKTIDDESLANAIEISKIPTGYVSAILPSFPLAPVSITSITRIQ